MEESRPIRPNQPNKMSMDSANLPGIADLSLQVRAVVDTSSWLERYGVDWLLAIAAAAVVPIGLSMLSQANSGTSSALAAYSLLVSGIFLLGCSFCIFSQKLGHLAIHGSTAHSPRWNRLWSYVFTEFIGSFSTTIGDEIHIQIHHPHTNIVGLGDSSTWKAPFLSRYIYMFLAPLTVPLLVPIVAVGGLLTGPLGRRWRLLTKYLLLAGTGLAFQLFLLRRYAGFGSIWTSLVCLYVIRVVFAIPYIHVNIFQHIGLEFYSPKDRPPRIRQMSQGVLNLSRNVILDLVFGHSLINCHVEHHLFPKLSDYMCLKIKPIVRDYLLRHGFQYHEEAYSSRLTFFVDQYEKLMVDAPPITHFVGLQ